MPVLVSPEKRAAAAYYAEKRRAKALLELGDTVTNGDLTSQQHPDTIHEGKEQTLPPISGAMPGPTPPDASRGRVPRLGRRASNYAETRSTRGASTHRGLGRPVSAHTAASHP